MEKKVLLRFYDGTVLYMNYDEYERDKVNLVLNGMKGTEKAEIPDGYTFKKHFWTHDVYTKE